MVCGRCTFNYHKVDVLPIGLGRSKLNLSPAIQYDVLLARIPYINILHQEKIAFRFPATFKPYYNKRLELTLIIAVERDCLLWGAGDIIPLCLQKAMLQDLYMEVIWVFLE